MHSDYDGFVAPGREVEARVDELLARLTLSEKLGMLGGVILNDAGNTVGYPEKGIPALKMADGPVGVHWWCDSSTAYPACIGLAASWDRQLGYQMGAALGRDARARGVHILLAPGVNIYRSPLCGRNFEYLGEDPYLAAEMVTDYIRGCQDQGVATTVKHYACNYQEYDRHGISTDADERTLREVYLPAFEAAVKRAGTGCLMTAYNLINGQHASEHLYLINEVLKGEWGFDGLVMSDWVSTYNEVQAANNGLDLEMPTARFLNEQKLMPAIENGLVTEAVIDDKIRRLLRLMVCFGWLDRPQQDTSIPLKDEQTWAVALEVARAGCVLLKNDRKTLPLDTSRIKRLAVIGSHASRPVICGGGSSYTPPNHLVSILDAMRDLAPESVQIDYAIGVDPWRHEQRFKDSPFRTADGRPGLLSEWYKGREATGAPDLVRVDEHVDFNWDGLPPMEDFPVDDYRICWSGEMTATETGEYVFYAGVQEAARYQLRVGSTVIIDSATAETGSIKVGRCDLIAGRSYPVQFTYCATRNWNAVRLGFEPASAAQAEFDAAVKLAGEADAVVLATGYTRETESEGFDRTFALPGHQEALLRAVVARNDQTTLLLHAGGNVDMDGWYDALAALLHVWYPGQEGGQAIAEILFGKVNPSGKLPATFEKRLEDRSSCNSYHDANGDKRVQLDDGIFGGYRHADRHAIPPRFPFGYGLSYTTFAYGDLQLDKQSSGTDDTVTASFTITNTGERVGAEVAQLYIRDSEASLLRPEKELKGFAKVQLDPGEQQRVSIEILPRALAFYDPARRDWIIEPGTFEVLIGASASDIRLTAAFNVS